jgi:uncharacterized protein with HEPN domain
MLDVIEEIQSFSSGMTAEQFTADAKTRKAVSADLAILGEAASFIPTDMTSRAASIPWPLIKGLRNRIIHAYFDVDPAILWDTVQNDLAPLAEALRALVETDAPFEKPPGHP